MKTKEEKTKRVHNLIIVDESGSMEVIRKQASEEEIRNR